MVSERKSGVVMFVAAFAAFLATFNDTFLNVALTPIMVDFAVTSALAQWTITAFALVAAVMVPVTGFLYQRIPTHKLFCFAVAVQLIGSVAGALAPSFAVLIGARVIQAIGAGMIPPLAINIVLAVAPRGKIGTYMGIVGAMTTLGPSASPVISGALLSFATWHYLFVLVAALSLALLIASACALRNVADLTKPRLDVLSCVLISVALVGIMYGISTAFSGQVAFAAGSFVAGVACFAVFALHQRTLEEPLLNFAPLASAPFRVGVITMLLALMTVFAMNIVLPLYLQGALGFTALGAALTLFPAIICATVLAPVCGRIYDRHGARVLLAAGAGAIAVFSCVLGLLAPTNPVLIAVIYALVIVGSAGTISPSQSYALDSLSREARPHGVTIVSTCFQIAACVGTSLFVGLFSSVESAGTAAGLGAAQAATSGFAAAALLGAAFGLVAFFVTLRIGPLERARANQPGSASAQATQAVRAAQATQTTQAETPGKPVRAFTQAAAESLPGNAQTTARVADEMGARALDNIMKRDVFSVTRDESAYAALRCMVNNRTSGVPVLGEKGELAGFIVDGDIMRYLAGGDPNRIEITNVYTMWTQGAPFFEKLDELKTMNVMELATRKVISVERSAGIEEVCRTLSSKTVKKVPVTESGRVVGTVSRSDLMRYLMIAR